jgi:predicted metal-binding protein
MSKHTLFICKSCHCSSEEQPEDQSTDGTRLLEQLNTASTEQLRELEIQLVECLWACSKPHVACVAAFSAPHKPTYLFTNLPGSSSAEALLQFGNLYMNSKTGNVPWKRFPKLLVSVAKIPAVDLSI